jgi:methylisocitrate lyase
MVELERKSKMMAGRLRRLIGRKCVALPGAFNAATARLIEQVGFEAVYVSGAGLSNATAGVPDIGLLSRREVAELAGYVAAAVDIPAMVDADTGFGDSGETVEQFMRAGIAAMQIEDQVSAKRCGHLGGKKLVSDSAMIGRIKSAAEARGRGNFVIVARTDARSVEGFESAVERAGKYLDAGADVIFPEALETEDEFAEFARRIRAPLLANMTEFGKSPLLDLGRLSRIGYRLAIFPQTAFRVAMKAEEAALRDLHKCGTQKSLLKEMQTRAELYQLLRYNPNGGEWRGETPRKRGR